MMEKSRGGYWKNKFEKSDGELHAANNIIKQLRFDNEKLKNITENLVLMPNELTAENGAKYLFMGEFKEVVSSRCPECYDLDDDDECEDCSMTMDVTVGWDTIKSIYELAVKKLAINKIKQ